MKKIFLVTIQITSALKEWDYEPNSNIIIPVRTNSKYNAQRKIETKYSGSEYPLYKIKSIKECDGFLFQPML